MALSGRTHKVESTRTETNHVGGGERTSLGTSEGDPGHDPDPAVVNDEVDRIVAAWQEQRPDLDPTPLHIFSRLARLSRHLELARRSAFDQYGLETWAFDVLTALRRSGEPYELTPGALLNETLVSSGTMTNRIDRLVESGLVTRVPSADDRRVIRVQLTRAGKITVDGAMAGLLEWENSLLERLGAGDQADLRALLKSLLSTFEPQ